MKLDKVASLTILLVAIVITLIYGQQLIIPFVIALLIWFLVREIKQLIDRSPTLKEKLPNWFKSLIGSILIISILGSITRLVSYNIQNLAASYEAYESNVVNITQLINTSFNINVMDFIAEHSGDFNYGTILGSLLNSISDIIGNAFLIVIYAIFIFLEEAYFNFKLRAVFWNGSNYDTTVSILTKIERSISRYIGLKTLVSLITGVLSYIVLLLVGIDAPIFWAFLIFILNFIPTIGSLIATLFPAAFALLQFGEFSPFVMVLVFVGAVQIVVGNIIEPKLMGNSLNISALVTILALSFWGSIWGVTGMLLSVPITVMIIIIFAQFPATRPIAIMLSEKGKIDVN